MMRERDLVVRLAAGGSVVRQRPLRRPKDAGPSEPAAASSVAAGIAVTTSAPGFKRLARVEDYAARYRRENTAGRQLGDAGGPEEAEEDAGSPRKGVPDRDVLMRYQALRAGESARSPSLESLDDIVDPPPQLRPLAQPGKKASWAAVATAVTAAKVIASPAGAPRPGGFLPDIRRPAAGKEKTGDKGGQGEGKRPAFRSSMLFSEADFYDAAAAGRPQQQQERARKESWLPTALEKFFN